MDYCRKFLFLITNTEKKQFMFLTILMLIASILEVLSISLIIPAVSILLDDSSIEQMKIYISPFLSENINNYVEANFLKIFIIFSLSIFLFKFIYMNLLIHKKMTYVSAVSTRISNRLFENYLARPYKFHLENSSSNLITNINGEVQTFSANALSAILEILIELIIIIGFLILIFLVEPIGSLLTIFVCGVAGFLFHSYTHKKTLERGGKRRKNQILALKIVQEGLGGIKELIVFSKKNLFLKKYFEFNSKLYSAFSKQQTLVDTSKYFIELIAIISAVILIFILTNSNETNQTIAKLSLFASIFFKVLPSLNRVVSAKQRVVFSVASVDVIYKEFKSFKISEIYQKKSNKKNNNIYFTKTLELKNISYSYSGNKKILKNINLTLKKGEVMGLVGPSGSGKSTLINILAGLLHPSSGNILVDGIPLNTSKKIEEWQKNIGYIPQNFFMLEDTIRSNIVFEPNYRTKNYDSIINKCLKNAQIFNFVKSLPKQLNTFIGERGSKISVGQAQRFSIARALYKNPNILILDEATSALDIDNEDKFLDLIYNLQKDITIIIISHKLRTLKFCDNIYKLEKLCLKKIKI